MVFHRLMRALRRDDQIDEQSKAKVESSISLATRTRQRIEYEIQTRETGNIAADTIFQSNRKLNVRPR